MTAALAARDVEVDYGNEIGFRSQFDSHVGKAEGIWKHMARKERYFFSSTVPKQDWLTRAHYRAEALLVLLWALRLTDRLDIGSGLSDYDAIPNRCPSLV